VRGEVEITPYRDGPYLVRGPFVLRAQDGGPIDVSRRTVALCRCGKSRIRPFCDGTHRLIKFRAPSESEHPYGEAPEQLEAGRRGYTRQSPPSQPALWAVGGQDGRLTRDASPGTPARRRIAQAGQELRRAHASLIGLLERPSSVARFRALSAAEPLLATACSVLVGSGQGEDSACAGARAQREVGPCTCLVKGALTELTRCPAEADRELRQLVTQLRGAVRLLELSQ
jgi:CDGSH-type Zn-finger protein